MASQILILNGPNLNMLGSREPGIYGYQTLRDIEDLCHAKAVELDAVVTFRQSNHEGELLDWIHSAHESQDVIIINPAGYGHTSVALLDALKASALPVIEVHLSNPLAREPFRHHSYVSLVATGVICGFGSDGYMMAIEAAVRLVERQQEAS